MQGTAVEIDKNMRCAFAAATLDAAAAAATLAAATLAADALAAAGTLLHC